jgi:hypothetical protein
MGANYISVSILGVLLIASAGFASECVGCGIDVSRRGCVGVVHGVPLPIYIYPTPFEYKPQEMNPYLLQLTLWLRAQTGVINATAIAVDNTEV